MSVTAFNARILPAEVKLDYKAEAVRFSIQMSSVLDDVVDGLELAPDIVSVLAATKPAFLLSLDVGTSGVRAALFDEYGNAVANGHAESKRKAASFSAFGELNPDAIVKQVIETIDELFTESFLPEANIQHVAISCFWHSLMGIDAKGKATTPLLTWADTRASEAAKDLRASFDETDLHQRTGCRFHPSYWPAKLRWLEKERADEYRKTVCWLGLAEYLSLRLFADCGSHIGMASASGLFNQSSCDWDWQFVDTLGIPRDCLPKIIRQGHPVLIDEFASRWPALSEAKLTVVLGDGAANNIGGGCCTRDRIALMVGTSGAMRVVYQGEPPTNLDPALWCYRADCSRVVVGGALSDGGGLFQWLTDLMSLGGERELLEESLANMEADSHGLTVLPFWAGERSTRWSSEARGGIFGFTQETTPVEIVRAALEGIAYRFALIGKALQLIVPDASIVATGNALHSSPVFRQILADVLGRQLIYGGSTEASIRGAALLALETVGKIGRIEEIAGTFDEVIEPDMQKHDRYQQGLVRQEDLYRRLIGDSIT